MIQNQSIYFRNLFLRQLKVHYIKRRNNIRIFILKEKKTLNQYNTFNDIHGHKALKKKKLNK